MNIIEPEQDEYAVASITSSINKQGKADAHKYMDHWIDDSRFHWQSQNATDPSSKRGQEIIRHAALGIDIHLFVREHKLAAGKAAPSPTTAAWSTNHTRAASPWVQFCGFRVGRVDGRSTHPRRPWAW
ncbi:MAG: DUF3427 domain-containing protein [Limnohabitans sp.]|uniref:DUF3427 domain-containing protein n=1 Tax=Limnohabitans sp. TaxID=1907725 RepID=UPI003918856B